jgi:cobyrinic acid a,c-diamide synthase
MVMGLRQLDSEVNIQGVVLNQVAGARHEAVLRRSIEKFAGAKVLGAIPRFHELDFPERHLGLVPPQEHGMHQEVIYRITTLVRDNVETDRVWEIANEAGDMAPVGFCRGREPQDPNTCFTVGVVRDEAFHFYYPENLEALEQRGARVVTISALETRSLPGVDALYIGGGFPEMRAEGLSQNGSLRQHIRQVVEAGLPVYAECGGLMYLGRALEFRGKEYPMVGALPLVSAFFERPQGHGYTALETINANPFFPRGTLLRGHEFHYSRITSLDDAEISFAFRVSRGMGIDGEKEGIVRKNVLATYTHLHALGCAAWGDGVAFRARRWKQDRQPDSVMGGGLY